MITYKHICEKCKYIKSIVIEGKLHDIYRCPAGPKMDKMFGDMWIARYGNSWRDYWSMDLELMKSTKDPKLQTQVFQTVYKIALKWKKDNDN
jgi:hypothetical protein